MTLNMITYINGHDMIILSSDFLTAGKKKGFNLLRLCNLLLLYTYLHT
jgi:hypothetical protein